MPDEPKPLLCPHCNKELHGGFVAKLTEQTSLSFTIKPEKGHRIKASTLGSCLINIEKLLQATARELNGTCLALVVGASVNDDSGVRVDLQLVQAERKERKKGDGQ